MFIVLVWIVSSSLRNYQSVNKYKFSFLSDLKNCFSFLLLYSCILNTFFNKSTSTLHVMLYLIITDHHNMCVSVPVQQCTYTQSVRCVCAYALKNRERNLATLFVIMKFCTNFFLTSSETFSILFKYNEFILEPNAPVVVAFFHLH